MIKLTDLVKEIQEEQQMKEGWKDIALGTAMTAATMLGGGNASAQKSMPVDNKPAISQTAQSQPTEQEIRNFLMNPNDDYHYWIDNLKNNYYSFDKNGTFFYEDAAYGEGGMEDGKWKIKGNKLIIITDNHNGTKSTEEYTVKIKKGKTPKEDQLILNNKVFKRD